MKNKKQTAIVLFLLAVLAGAHFAAAQNPTEIILTWQAMNFYPSDYKAKAVASLNTPVVVSATAVKNDRIRDLSDATITWYLDNKFFNRGKGLREIIFNVKKSAGNEYLVKAEVDFGNEFAEKTFSIPVGSQKVVIDTPLPNRSVSLGDKVILGAIPYFFNVGSFDEITFGWKINNTTREEGKSQVVLEVGTNPDLSGEEIKVFLLARNVTKLLEIADETQKLFIR